MSAGRHAAGDASFARSAGGAMTRGIVLIVVAVLIGILLIRTAVPDSGDIAGAGPADTTTPPVTTAPTEPSDTTAVTADTTEITVGDGSTPSSVVTDDTTETTVGDGSTSTTKPELVFEPRENNLVSVQVANTTTTGGAAGRQTDAFKEGGYTVKKATNWTEGVLSKTKIHYIDGFLPEARALAVFVGLDPNDDVFQMPATPEAKIGEFQDPDILVLLGSDLAT